MTVNEDSVKAKAQKVLNEKLDKQVQDVNIQSADIIGKKVVIDPDNQSNIWDYREKGKRPSWVKQLEESGKLNANIRITRYDKITESQPQGSSAQLQPQQLLTYEITLEEAKKIARNVLESLSTYYDRSGGAVLEEKDLALGEVSLAPLCRKYYSKNIAYKEEIIAAAFVFIIHINHNRKSVNKRKFKNGNNNVKKEKDNKEKDNKENGKRIKQKSK